VGVDLRRGGDLYGSFGPVLDCLGGREPDQGPFDSSSKPVARQLGTSPVGARRRRRLTTENGLGLVFDARTVSKPQFGE